MKRSNWLTHTQTIVALLVAVALVGTIGCGRRAESPTAATHQAVTPGEGRRGPAAAASPRRVARRAQQSRMLVAWHRQPGGVGARCLVGAMASPERGVS